MSSKKGRVYNDMDEFKSRFLNFLDEKYEYFDRYYGEIEDKILGCLFYIELNCKENNLSQQQKEDMIGVLNDIFNKYINLLINNEKKVKLKTRIYELRTLIHANSSARSLRGGSNKKVKKVRKIKINK
jgi:hypothetical protein